MLDWGRYLPGLGSDEPEDDDPVTKTLKALGQGVQSAGSAISSVVGSAEEAAGAAGAAVGSGLRSAAETVGSYLPELPAERPPQYSGPSYSQPTREQAGLPPIGVTEPIAEVGATIRDAASAGVSTLLRPVGVPAEADPQTEEEARALLEGVPASTQLRHAANPAAQYSQYQEAQDAALGVVGRRAGAGAGLSDVKQPYETPLGTFEVSPQDVTGFAAQVGLDPMNLVGPGPTVRGGRAVVEASMPAVREGAEAVGRGLGQVADVYQQGRATAAALNAQPTGTVTPGVFGLSGLEPDLPAVQGLRPRIIPEDVADQLDYPIKPPTDPAVIRAIEAAGGTVDERGTTLNVIRMQDPEAAGGAATRSSVFYTAGPPGAPSEYARTGPVGPQGVGGQQRIEGRTRFRNPLFISDAPGEAAGFDDAMRQMRGSDRATIEAAQREVDDLYRRMVDSDNAYDAAVKAGRGAEAEAAHQPIAEAYDAAKAKLDAMLDVPRASWVEDEIAQAKRAGPAGSPERAAALKTLVTRYGGDPDVIDDLIELRGAEMGESVYAVKENIVAGNARRAGHDGVITIQQQSVPIAEINAHPAVVAAKERAAPFQAEYFAAQRAGGRHIQEGQAAGFGAAGTIYDPEWPAIRDRIKAAEEALDPYNAAITEARGQAARELSKRQITELADPREARNPTPGTPTAELKAAYRRAKDAEARFNDLYRGPPAAEEAFQAARREVEEANAALEALMNATDTPSGYTLRPDIPRRAPVRESTIGPSGRLAEARAHYEQALQAAAGKPPSSPEVQALMQASDEFAAAKRAGDFETTAQASAGALPTARGAGALPAVNRALSEGLAGGVGGAVIEQGRNPDEDPRTAAARGFAAGAVGFPLATRAARGAARLAGAAPSPGGALGTFGSVPPVDPDEIADLARRAAETPMTGPHTNGQHVVRNVSRQIQKQVDAGVPAQVPDGPMAPPDPPPGWWDHVESWRYNLGLFAQLSTGMVQAAGGVVQALGGGAAEALRLGVLKGQPEALLPIAGEALRAIPGALKSAALTAAGQVPKAIQAGSDYKPPVHAREFAQGNVGRGIASLAVGTPGRVMTQAPDALWYEMFQKAGIAQAAADEAQRQVGSSPLRMAERLRIQQNLIANPTPEIEAEATKLAQNATYKGEPGQVLGAPKKVTEALGPVGSFFMPIYNTIARIHEQALEYAPGVGLLPLEKVGLAPKNQARPVSRRIAQQAVGASVVLGGLSYAAEGGIRGPGPSNPNEAQAMRDLGYTPNTTNVGGYWIPNTWFGPWGPILNEIGAINDARVYDLGDKGWDDLTWEKKAAAIIKMSGRAAMDYPALETAQSITKLFTAPEDALPSFLGEVAAQYVPGPLRTKAMAEDTKARTRTRGPDVPFEQRFEETVRQRSGVGREQLPVAQDILGRDVANPRQGWGKALAPNIREEKPDPIIQAFLDADLNIGDPPTELSVGALKPGLESPELTPEETRRWNTIRGEQVIKSVGTLLASDAWATHDAAWRKQALEARRSAAGEFATGALRKEIGETEVRRRMAERGSRKAAS